MLAVAVFLYFWWQSGNSKEVFSLAVICLTIPGYRTSWNGHKYSFHHHSIHQIFDIVLHELKFFVRKSFNICRGHLTEIIDFAFIVILTLTFTPFLKRTLILSQLVIMSLMMILIRTLIFACCNDVHTKSH